MTNIELYTRSVFDRLSQSEKKVATYFLAHAEDVFHMPIAQLAAASGASQVAWVRFCKTIGFTGLKDLKKNLFAEISESEPGTDAAHEMLYADIKNHTSVSQMVEMVKNSSNQAIDHTMQLLDHTLVERAADLLIQANSVRIFGMGASALVGEDLFNKLLRIGKNVCFCRDLHIQLTYASNSTPADAAVFISHSGSTQEVLEALELVRANGTPTLAITSLGGPLSTGVEMPFFVCSPEVYRRSCAMSSRIAQLTVVDVLFTAVANRDYANVESKLERSFESCRTHKVDNGRLPPGKRQE